MIMKQKICILALIGLSFSMRVGALEPLSAQVLAEYCADYQAVSGSGDVRCVTYIKGFLDGAIATDSRVAENVVRDLEEPETLAERAFRTRVTDRLAKYGPSVYAEFCVGDPVPIADVVNRVMQTLVEHQDLANNTARTIVYSALRQHYACEADDA